MIKMVVLDMDGTLLNKDDMILPETKEALMAVQKKGIRLVLASGRSYMRMMRYVKELQMDQYGGYLVEINGTAIYDLAQNKREVLSQLSIKETQSLFRYFKQWDVEILGNFDDGMYCYMSDHIHEEKVQYRKTHNIADDVPWTAGPYRFIYDNRNGYPNIVYIQSELEIKRTLNKVSVSYHEDIMEQIAEHAKTDLKDRYWTGLVSKRWLEVMPLGVTKVKGLREIAQRTGITLQEMMVFGDSENDIAMLKEAGWSVVMGNALAGIKEYGDEITDTNHANGVGKALQKYFDL